MVATVISKPLLDNGDVMDREEFMRRYEACEDLEHVELIEGVVYMPSPIIARDHSKPQLYAIGWLFSYKSLHPEEVEAFAPGTVLLDQKNAPEPDALLCRVTPDLYNEKGYIAKVPELIFEVANSSVSRDLHQKKRAYERNGVREYIVWRVQDKAIDWFGLRDGRYELRQPDANGLIGSDVFPGLRLHVPSMLAADSAALLAHLS
jgi:Uma2 family endonuclease